MTAIAPETAPDASARAAVTIGGSADKSRSGAHSAEVMASSDRTNDTGVRVRTAQQHGRAYVPRLLDHAQRFSPGDSRTGYRMFKHKEDGCLRVVFMP